MNLFTITLIINYTHSYMYQSFGISQNINANEKFMKRKAKEIID